MYSKKSVPNFCIRIMKLKWYQEKKKTILEANMRNVEKKFNDGF